MSRVVPKRLCTQCSAVYVPRASSQGRCRAHESRSPSSRRRVPAAVRRLVYARDGHACVRCGATVDLTLDHVIPASKGGSDESHNLRTMCRPCNSRRGAGIP